MFKYFDNLDLKFSLRVFDYDNYKYMNYLVPSSWYITPLGHLYNSMSCEGHKMGNLIYQYKDVFPHEVTDFNNGTQTTICIKDYRMILNKINKIDNLELLKNELQNYLHLKIDIVYNDTYINNLKKLLLGFYSAEGSFYKFFDMLYSNKETYEENLNFLKNYSLDEILIRCIGFHKITHRTIVTSSMNYEEDFLEYKCRNWNIDFISPIVFDYDTGLLKEIDKEKLMFLNRH